MHNYKGKYRKDDRDTHTPTKSSWDRDRDHAPSYKNQPRHSSKYQTTVEQRNEPVYQNRYKQNYERSELSYYQSQQSSRMEFDHNRSQRPSGRSNAYNYQDQYVFNQLMEVKISSYDREQTKQKMRIQIQTKNDKGKSFINILLTDDHKPTILWHFAIYESDFMTLKNEQKLKVHYSDFPFMLQKLFEECLDPVDYHEEKSKNIQLTIKKPGVGILTVLESTKFKESDILSLHIEHAKDQYIKEFLSNKLMQTQDELMRHQEKLSRVQAISSQRMKEKEELQAQLKEEKRQNDKKLQDIIHEEKRKMHEMVEKSMNERRKEKNQADLELKQLKKSTNNEIQRLRNLKDELSQKLGEAKTTIFDLETSEKDSKKKIERLSTQADRNNKEIDKLRVDNQKLSTLRYENGIKISELSSKIEALRSQIEDKKTIISSTVENKESISSQITSLEEQKQENRKHIVKLEKKITELEEELSKANSTSNSYSQKILKQKEKLKDMAQILKKQEKEKKQIQKSEATLTREKQDLIFKNQQKDKTIKGLKIQLEESSKKIEEQNQMVLLLQKQGTQPSTYRVGTHTSYHPTAPYSNVGRQLPSQLSANSHISASRSTYSTQNYKQDRPQQKFQPTIKRYEQRQRSKSPIVNKRLTQQRQPEDDDVPIEKVASFDQPRPVKFKMSQPRQ